MKKVIIASLLFFLVSINLVAENMNTYSATFTNITKSGCAVIYAKSNPIEVLSVSPDWSSIFVSLHKFKDFQKNDLTVVLKPDSIANYRFESHESAENALSLANLRTYSPSKKECEDYVQKIRTALEKKQADEIATLCFSKTHHGLNPDEDLIFPDGSRKKHSDLIAQKFREAKSVQVLSRIQFWRGKNFTMISGEDGKIFFLIDGEKFWLLPIYISKSSSKGKIEVL